MRVENNKYKICSRIGAMIRNKEREVLFLGYGTYLGHVIPPKEVCGQNLGIPSPQFLLDNGDIVYGCECWWAGEELMKELVSDLPVVTVRISDYRGGKNEA